MSMSPHDRSSKGLLFHLLNWIKSSNSQRLAKKTMTSFIQTLAFFNIFRNHQLCGNLSFFICLGVLRGTWRLWWRHWRHMLIESNMQCEGEVIDFNSNSSCFVNSSPLNEFGLSAIEVNKLFLEVDKLFLFSRSRQLDHQSKKLVTTSELKGFESEMKGGWRVLISKNSKHRRFLVVDLTIQWSRFFRTKF